MTPQNTGTVIQCPRMIINLARGVTFFIERLFEVPIVDVPTVVDIPDLQPHEVTYSLLLNAGTFNGHADPRELLELAVKKRSPQSIIFVVPGTFNRLVISRLLDVFSEISQRVPFFVLELSVLSKLGLEPSLASARRNISRFPGTFDPDNPTLLIPEP